MIELFRQFSFFIVPLHTLSAMVWLGGMIVFVLVFFPTVKQIPNEKTMIRTMLRALIRFFYIGSVAALFVGITGYVMKNAKALAQKDPTLGAISGAVEVLWILMFMSFVYAGYKAFEAKKECLGGDVHFAHDNILLIIYYIFSINILMGVVATYFGLLLRGV